MAIPILDNILLQVKPMDTDIYEWHCVFTGAKGSPYEGGHYHGMIIFPPDVSK